MPYKDKAQQKAAQKRHYSSNKAAYRESTRKNRDERSLWFNEIKSKMCCVQCGYTDLRCLDFHHRNQDEKKFSISLAVSKAFKQEKILEEMAKCDVLCANCHMKHHWTERQENTAAYIYPDFIVHGINWLNEYKSHLSCAACNNQDWMILSFHHLGDKRDTISNMVYHGCPIPVLLEEISKCKVLCFNCHRIEHNGMKWGDTEIDTLGPFGMSA